MLHRRKLLFLPVAILAAIANSAVATSPPAPYRVMFEDDSPELSASAKERLDQLVEDFRVDKSIKHLNVRGHYDRTGTPDHRVEVSRRYAEAVRSYLLDAGIPSTSMTVTWVGDSEPAVPTADNIPEADNRTVVIEAVRD